MICRRMRQYYSLYVVLSSWLHVGFALVHCELLGGLHQTFCLSQFTQFPLMHVFIVFLTQTNPALTHHFWAFFFFSCFSKSQSSSLILLNLKV